MRIRRKQTNYHRLVQTQCSSSVITLEEASCVCEGRRDKAAATCPLCCCPMIMLGRPTWPTAGRASIPGLSLETRHHRWPFTPKNTLTETAHVLQSHRDTLCYKHRHPRTRTEPHSREMIILISNIFCVHLPCSPYECHKKHKMSYVGDM